MIEKILPTKLSRYLIKNLLKMFSLIFVVSFMIVFMVNFFEFSSKIQKYSINHFVAIKIITYRSLPILEVIMFFILALAINFELMRISEKNELIIMYMSNYSPWKVLKSIVTFAIIIGFLDITLFNRLSVKLYNISEELFLKSMGKNVKAKFLESKSGIWLNLKLADGKDLIIKSDKVFIDDELIFETIDGLLIDENGKLTKKITADNMSITDNEITFNNLFYIEKNELNHYVDKIVMITNMDNKFIKKQLLNKYEKLKLIPFLLIKKLINDYKIAGLNTKKFEANMFNFISKPFYFVFIVCFIFTSLRIDQRNSKNILITLKVIIMTITLFIIRSIISELVVGDLVYSHSNLSFSIFILLFILKAVIKKIELV